MARLPGAQGWCGRSTLSSGRARVGCSVRELVWCPLVPDFDMDKHTATRPIYR